MTLFLSIVLWILLGWVTSYFAQQRGRDPLIWFLIGMLLGLIGLLLLFILPPVEEESGAQSPSEEAELSGEPKMVVEMLDEKSLPFQHLNWFYMDLDHKQIGPISFKQLKDTWMENKVGPGTFVWSEQMSNWKKIEELPDLKIALESDEK